MKAWDLIRGRCRAKFVEKWGKDNMMFPEKEFLRALEVTKTVWSLIQIVQTFKLTRGNTLGECQDFVYKLIEEA